MIRRAAAAACIGLAGVCLVTLGLRGVAVPADGPVILGAKPGYGPVTVSAVSNEAAITRHIWMPGLDEGYDPQGLAVAGDDILVAAYRSESADIHRGPCRVFRVDATTGSPTGQFEVPAPCGHAGGLATAANGRLYVADTHNLFATNLAGAFGGESRLRVIPLGAGLTGGLAASGGDSIWLGTYREDGPGRLYRFSIEALEHLPEGSALSASDAAMQIAIPSYAQGAAIDAAGHLWVVRSDLRWGELDRLDTASGKVERDYPAAPGVEGLAFDAAGRLWAVSEAGARHYYEGWRALVLPFYPLIFAIDPDRLR
jgi:sugar lactone lactonase YvrE